MKKNIGGKLPATTNERASDFPSFQSYVMVSIVYLTEYSHPAQNQALLTSALSGL